MSQCVLLGAGASKDAGVPTSLEMTWSVVEQLEAESNGNPDATLQAIYFALGGLMFGRGQRGQSPLQVDIEALFRAMELLETREQSELAPFIASWNEPKGFPTPVFQGRRLGDLIRSIALEKNGPLFKGDQLSETIKTIVSGSRLPYREARQRMVGALRSIVWVPDTSSWDYLTPLVKEASSSPDFTIASLNYDNGVELAARHNGVEMSVGFDVGIPAVTPNFSEGRPCLVKLHGSIDWLRGGSRPKSGEQFSEYTVTRITDPADFQSDEEHPRFEPALIFGGGNKLRADGPFLDLLSEFRRRLDQSDRLTIIGYSFRDDHVNHLIARWFNNANNREVFVVDPCWKEQYGYSEELQFQRTLTHLLRSSRRVNLIEKAARDAIAELQVLW